MNRAGSLLIVTLWLVTLLAVLAVAIARHLSLDVRLTKHRLAHERAHALARSGVYLAMQRLMQDGQAPEPDGKVYDWSGDDWAYFPQPDDPAADPTRWVVPFPEADDGSGQREGEVRIRIIDEARRLPVNTASIGQLEQLLGDHDLAQALIDEIDPADPLEDRPEDQPPYFAKNGPVVAIEELSDLPLMTPEAYAELLEHTTPYPLSQEALNINTVVPGVLRAVGVSESAVGLIEQFREGPDGAAAHEQDGRFTEAGQAILQTLEDEFGVNLAGTTDGNLLSSSLFAVSSETFTVVSEGIETRWGGSARIQAVIRRSSCGQAPAPCILAWREG